MSHIPPRTNSAHRIETLTRAALATSDEALKIDLLRLLDGVAWPTASTILHFCDARPYPILDHAGAGHPPSCYSFPLAADERHRGSP